MKGICVTLWSLFRMMTLSFMTVHCDKMNPLPCLVTQLSEELQQRSGPCQWFSYNGWHSIIYCEESMFLFVLVVWTMTWCHRKRSGIVRAARDNFWAILAAVLLRLNISMSGLQGQTWSSQGQRTALYVHCGVHCADLNTVCLQGCIAVSAWT